MNYSLPVAVEIDGDTYLIRNRGDWRMVLDVLIAFADADMTNEEKFSAALTIFYETMPKNLEKAITEMVSFIDGGKLSAKRKASPRLMDWEQDFPIIIAPINRVLGCEIRALDYLHWWSFLSAYMEISDCTFSTVISIRQKQAKHKKLEKWEQAFVREHSELVRLRPLVSESEQAYLDSFCES